MLIVVSFKSRGASFKHLSSNDAISTIEKIEVMPSFEYSSKGQSIEPEITITILPNFAPSLAIPIVDFPDRLCLSNLPSPVMIISAHLTCSSAFEALSI